MPKSDTPASDAVLVKYLNEAYGKEKQLETVLQAQIKLASRPALKKGLQDHLKVTKAQARGLQKRIKQLNGVASENADLPVPDVVADAAAAGASVVNKAMAAAKGPIQALRGTSDADNELRNVRDAIWNEAEEIAHYDVIEAVATELKDTETAKLARDYRKDEEKMQKLLERQLGPLTKAVIKAEVPRAELKPATPSRSRTRSSSARKPAAANSSRSTSRAASSGSASKPTAAKRVAAAAKPADAKKPPARKSAARKPAARKPAAKKS